MRKREALARTMLRGAGNKPQFVLDAATSNLGSPTRFGDHVLTSVICNGLAVFLLLGSA